MTECKLFTIGYGRWPPDRRIRGLIDSLKAAGVNTLIDIRHSPCSSQLDVASNYGPRDWHLQSGGRGIEHMLNEEGIEYRWLVELGNPQKTDPEMAIFRSHLESGDRRWPVTRGVELLEQLLREPRRTCCILCACKEWRECHRLLVAEAIANLWSDGTLEVVHLPIEYNRKD